MTAVGRSHEITRFASLPTPLQDEADDHHQQETEESRCHLLHGHIQRGADGSRRLTFLQLDAASQQEHHGDDGPQQAVAIAK